MKPKLRVDELVQALRELPMALRVRVVRDALASVEDELVTEAVQGRRAPEARAEASSTRGLDEAVRACDPQALAAALAERSYPVDVLERAIERLAEAPVEHTRALACIDALRAVLVARRRGRA